MIPAILRQAAAMDGITGELFKHHREEKHFVWPAPPREAGRPSRMTLIHASHVAVTTVAMIPKNHYALEPAAVPPPSLTIAGDTAEFRASLNRLGIIAWAATPEKKRLGETWPIYSACFPWRNWQANAARVHREYRPLPKHPYATFLLFCFRVLRRACEWSGEIPSDRDWHYLTRKAVAHHWKTWAHANGYTWADFSRASPTTLGEHTLLKKTCHRCRLFLPLEEFSANGKPSKRTICRDCDTAARKDRRAKRQEEMICKNLMPKMSELPLKNGLAYSS